MKDLTFKIVFSNFTSVSHSLETGEQIVQHYADYFHKKKEDILLTVSGSDSSISLLNGTSHQIPDNDDQKGNVSEHSTILLRFMAIARAAKLFPSRATLLTVKEQHQALLLCLARRNKKLHGEFYGIASDLLDVWNSLMKSALDDQNKSNQTDINELTESYSTFIESSKNIDVFRLYKAFKKALAGDLKKECWRNEFEKVLVINVEELSDFEWNLISLLLPHSEVYISVYKRHSDCTIECSDDFYDLNGESVCSSINKYNQVEALTLQSVNDIFSLDILPKTPWNKKNNKSCTTPANRRGVACREYVLQVMLSQIRLLLNTRDELALAINCSLPGTELTQEAFADIKAEAHSKSMPMYQTVLSLVVKVNLGGKGYQPSALTPILQHVKALKIFVDHITELSTVIEDTNCARTATKKVLNRIKRYLVQQATGISSNCPLKISVIESVHNFLVQILEKKEKFECCIPTAPDMPKALCVLQELCDSIGAMMGSPLIQESAIGLVSDCNSSSYLLSQDTSNLNVSSSTSPKTPLRVPSILSLFKTPEQNGDEDVSRKTPSRGNGLRKQAMQNLANTPLRRSARKVNKSQSCLAWAPDNLSPISYSSPVVIEESHDQKDVSDMSTEECLKMIASLPDSRENNPPKLSLPKKRSSKRSLLPVMTSVANEENSLSKQPPAKKKKLGDSLPKKKILPRNQKAITSFFKKT